ncbi:MAG: DNA-3-methyladenine glycosylase family protein [Acidimicrobiales bacterium]
MAGLVAEHGPCRLEDLGPSGSHFETLVESILYQQLAGRAAAAIHARFLALLPEGRVEPSSVLALPETALRAAGLSANKAASIRDLADRIVSCSLVLEGIEAKDDDQIVEELTRVRGIGVWTAEMFLLFRLQRPDVWPVGDLGVRRGYAMAYGLGEMPAPKALLAMGEPFRPWRSLAAWYCWRVADGAGRSGAG